MAMHIQDDMLAVYSIYWTGIFVAFFHKILNNNIEKAKDRVTVTLSYSTSTTVVFCNQPLKEFDFCAAH